MSSIAEGIAYVLEQARKEREQEKRASASESSDPAEGISISHTPRVAHALKTASTKVRGLRGDVRVGDVQHLLETLSREHE